MEIVLTVIGVLVFFGGSYFLGNFLLGFEDDDTSQKVGNSLFRIGVMVLIFLIVVVVSVCIHEGVVILINI